MKRILRILAITLCMITIATSLFTVFPVNAIEFDTSLTNKALLDALGITQKDGQNAPLEEAYIKDGELFVTFGQDISYSHFWFSRDSITGIPTDLDNYTFNCKFTHHSSDNTLAGITIEQGSEIGIRAGEYTVGKSFGVITTNATSVINIEANKYYFGKDDFSGMTATKENSIDISVNVTPSLVTVKLNGIEVSSTTNTSLLSNKSSIFGFYGYKTRTISLDNIFIKDNTTDKIVYIEDFDGNNGGFINYDKNQHINSLTNTFLPHTWDGGVVTKEPTKTSEGTTVYTCIDCGAKKTVMIPATHAWLNHAYENIDLLNKYGFTINGGISKAFISKGALHITPDSVSNYSYFYLPQGAAGVPDNLTNFSYSVDMAFLQDRTNKLSGITIGNNAYIFGYRSGEYAENKTLANVYIKGGTYTGNTEHFIGQGTLSDISNATGVSNNLQIDVTPETITFYINGIKIETLVNDGGATSMLGIIDYKEWPVAFDNIMVTDKNTNTVVYSLNFEDHVAEFGWLPIDGDEESHHKICNCDFIIESEKHSWDNGVAVTDVNELCGGTGTKYTCTECGYTKYVGEEHKLVDVIKKQPTCKEPGVIEKVCSVCGKVVSTAEIPVTDHVFGEWYIKTPATETQNGIKARKCSICGEEEIQVYNYGDEPNAVSTTTPDPDVSDNSNNKTVIIIIVIVFSALILVFIAYFVFIRRKRKQ